MTRLLTFCAVLFGCGVLCLAEEPASADSRPCTAVEAREKVGEIITVQFRVQAVKDRLEKKGIIYLDSETDFHNPKNFAVIITRPGAQQLKTAGIDRPAEHFRDKIIQARGKVILVEEMPRIEIESASQIHVVKPPQPDSAETTSPEKP